MSGFLLDTHIWYWYLLGSNQLPDRVQETIEASPELCRLSPISVWELGMLAARGRLRLEGELRSWLGRAFEAFPLREAALNREVALRSLELRLHRDPADRFLAATALVYDLTLLTVDRRLTGADWLRTQGS